MEIKYEIKGIILNSSECSDICHYYEQACTANLLMDEYGIEDENKAMEMAHEIRSRMADYYLSESDAIVEVVEEMEDDEEYDDDE